MTGNPKKSGSRIAVIVSSPSIIRVADEYARAENVKLFIEKLCKVPEGKLIGQAFKLLPFELEFIKNVYRTDKKGRRKTRRAILSMARKNGKSAFISCLALIHLVGPEAVQNSQLYSTAQTREQALIISRLMMKVVRQDVALKSNIWGNQSSGTFGIGPGTAFQSLSANSAAAFGLSPVFAIHDELGQAGAICPIYDAVETGTGAHEEPLSIIISTQAADDVSLLSTLIDDALNNPQPNTYLQLHTTPENYELNDPKGWRFSNPALGIYRSEEDIREQADRAIRLPSSEPAFRNLYLNQRVNVVGAFLSRSIWERNGDDPHYEECRGMEAWVSIDLSSRIDLTSMTVVVPLDGADKFSVFSYSWLPEHNIADREIQDKVPYRAWVKGGYLDLAPGKSIDYRWVVNRIKTVMEHFDVRSIAYDRWRIDSLKMALDAEEIDIPLQPFGQGYKDMSPAIEATEGLAVEGRLLHGGNPVLKWAMSNSRVAMDPSGNRKLDKSKANTRIDPAVSLVMAIGSYYKEIEGTASPSLIIL
jgi:phage terminase large subunit-like protein